MDHSSGLSSCAMGNASSRVNDAVTPGPDGSDMVASGANSCPSGGNGGDGLRRCNGHLQSTDGSLAILQQAVAQMSNGAGLQPEGQTPAPSTTPPSTPGRLQTCPNQSGSPEIKLRITKTYLDGKPLFESSLCGESTDEADVSLPIPNQQPEVTVGHASTEAARPPTPPGSQGTVTPVEGQLAPDAVAEKPSVPSDVEQYHVGDLVWAKIRGHPWWPCMVSHDPKLFIHFQLKEMSKTTSRRYHMQFFGPAAERAWLVERSIVAYKGLEQYDELVAQLAQRASSSTERAKIVKPMPPRVKTQWDVAVAEVKEAALLDREERLETFTFFYFDPKEEKANRQHKKAQSSTKRAAGKIGQAGKQTEHLSPNLQEEPMAAVGSVDKLGLRLAEPSTQGEDQAMALFARFCQNQQGLIQQEFPGASPGELQAILSSRWERLSAQEKASFASNHVVSPSGSSQCQSNSPSLPDTAQDSSHHSEELHPRKRRRQDVKVDSSLPLPPGREEMSGKTPARPICKGAVQMSDNCKPLKKRGLASMGTSCSPSDVDEDLAAPGEPSSDPEVSIGAFDAASPEVNEDSQHGGRRIRRDICQVCEKPGDSLVLCEGQCCSVYHMECLALNKTPTGKMLCKECTTGVHPCFACKVTDCGTVRRCMVSACGKFYHENCLRDLPSALVDHRGNFRCPMHSCLTCQLDCHSKLRVNRGRLVRCVRCPVAYHVSENLRCLAAGSKLLSSTSIVCSSHFTPSKNSKHGSHMNVNWCFLCSRGCLLQTRALFAFSGHYLMNESKHAHVACKLPMIPVVPAAAAKASGKGGSLLCCESCPATFHLDCLGIEPPDGSWICSDCRLGRKPRYRDIVWVKFGSFRWWPAEICPPRAVPSNIQALRHGIGEFPVRFFGSHDYQYMHQGRVFPYVEGDKGNCNGSTLALNSSFQKALQEAAVRYQELKAEQEMREAQEIERNERKPPYYKEIKTNKPVGKVQILTADLSEITRCSCKATDEGACGLDSECLNRILLYECHPMVCPAGERCNNQSFSKRLYPPAEVFRASACGWGLRTKVDIRKGMFVNEYVGELVDEEECRKRIKLAHENDVTHFYMLTLAKDRIIDAGPKGNLSRFMNHSCQPNCETQKWSVNGDARVGLFALCDIKAGTELTFNYNLDCLGNEKTVCKCGADNCSGFLGVRPKTAVAAAVEERIKKVRPKARRSGARFRHEDDCFRCGLSGELVMCGRKGCPKSYHVSCLQLDKPPHGRWDCPWHHCDVCGKASVALCHYCPDSFCKDHQAGALLPTGVEGRLTCARHEEELEDRSSTDLVNLDTVVADVVESCA